ncbi:oxidoreductase [Neobacillus piezotolerans]|uniref:Oxidoreductase n=1 Tax=Neobacillus piezotolerans TaxID=2259171 RepID=A0A3D8GUW1_9BACI|nr:aldo/keto reductase [Neobacillus piezotolerans]RDU38263.1 oxidoreductase [Neobacillus piezotolerans]
MIKKVRLGRTDLEVNPIGMGTNAVGGHNIYPNIDEEASFEMIRSGLENGLNFFDTAYYYGLGRSEEIIGQVVKEAGKRAETVIATKASYTFAGQEVVHNNDPAFLTLSVEESLKRLQSDYIDLFYIHFPDKDTPKDEAVGALKRLKDEGKIRAIGVSNFSLEQLKEANKDGHIDVYQGEYNLLNRSAEQELFPYFRENNISFIPYFPLAKGLLTGKYDRNSNLEGKRGKFFEKETFERALKKVEKLKEIAEQKGADVAHVVLAWYLTRDVIDAIIPGAKRPEQVLNNLKTLEVNLSEEEIREIDLAFRQ